MLARGQSWAGVGWWDDGLGGVGSKVCTGSDGGALRSTLARSPTISSQISSPNTLHTPTLFSQPPQIQIHTWADASLGELKDLIKTAINPGGEQVRSKRTIRNEVI